MLRSGALVGLIAAAAVAACQSGADVGGSGSGGSGGEGSCPEERQPKVDAVADIAGALAGVRDALRDAVAPACAAIATDLGASGVPDASDPASMSPEEVELACSLAASAIASAGEVAAIVSASRCVLDHQAQLDCEQDFVEAGCDPGGIERCADDALSVACSGACGGSCTWDGTTPVSCQGACEGVCTGTCLGTCSAMDPMGACAGHCAGTCAGTCAGRCVLDSGAATQCGGFCQGGCEGVAAEPACTEPLAPPACSIESSCASLCASRGLFGTSCDPVAVLVDPAFGASLGEQLPAVLHAYAELEQVVVGAQMLHDVLVEIQADLQDSPGCSQSLSESIATVNDSFEMLQAILDGVLAVEAELH